VEEVPLKGKREVYEHKKVGGGSKRRWYGPEKKSLGCQLKLRKQFFDNSAKKSRHHGRGKGGPPQGTTTFSERCVGKAIGLWGGAGISYRREDQRKKGGGIRARSGGGRNNGSKL